MFWRMPSIRWTARLFASVISPGSSATLNSSTLLPALGTLKLNGVSWPGVASYALDALLSSDYAPVQGFVLLMASVFVIVNLLVDILYGIADPRVTIG